MMISYDAADARYDALLPAQQHSRERGGAGKDIEISKNEIFSFVHNV